MGLHPLILGMSKPRAIGWDGSVRVSTGQAAIRRRGAVCRATILARIDRQSHQRCTQSSHSKATINQMTTPILTWDISDSTLCRVSLGKIEFVI